MNSSSGSQYCDCLSLPLSLRFMFGPAPAGEAWLIPGDDAKAWIDEIASWGVALSDLKLYVLPVSVHDRWPAAALVLPPRGTVPRSTSRAMPYRLLGGILYAPATSELFPPTSDEELRRMCAHSISVWHPSIGLVGFAREDSLKVEDLLVVSARRLARWSSAVAGVPINARLLSVSPSGVQPVEMILDGGRDDIGMQSPHDVPRDPTESKLKNALISAGAAFAFWLSRIPTPRRRTGAPRSRMSPPSAARRWLGKIGRFITSGGAALNAARERELNRLLNLLNRDPDAGLRYAIPLHSSGSRGLGAVGDRLVPRSTDFLLDSLSGGHAADPWNIESQMRQRLIIEYRRSATRELQLGRHRRAAYIFATLLGDLSSAANALKQGHLYRDAAAIYRDRLKNPTAAASCLESGGLLQEAAELYVQIEQFEKSGDLYARLENPSEANRWYNEAVNRALKQANRRDAARILNDHLRRTDDALATLREGWPAAADATACLREFFDLLGRHARHADARHQIRELSQDPSLVDAAPFAGVLADLANVYPDPSVRGIAADTARVAVGRRLPECSDSEASALIASIMRLDSGDRLLARDCSRFLAARTSKGTRPRPIKPATKVKTIPRPKRVATFHLGTGISWRAAMSYGSVVFALGESGGGTVIVRWSLPDVFSKFVTPIPVRATPAWLRYLRRPDLMAIPAPPMIATSDQGATLSVGLPGYLALKDVVALDQEDDGTLWAVIEGEEAEGDYSLNAYDHYSGELLSSSHRTFTTDPIYIVARRQHITIANGPSLYCVETFNRREEEIQLPGRATGLAPSWPFTIPRVALTLEDGGAVMFWPGGDAIVPFADGLVDAAAAFLPNGELAIVGNGEGRVYRCTTDQKVTRVGDFNVGARGKLLAVLAVSSPAGFATISSDGAVEVYSVPNS